jgi:hypothetical protein
VKTIGSTHCRLFPALCQVAASIGLVLSVAANSQAETRRVYSDDAPPWLQAVGVLSVPGVRYREGRRRHYREECSGTLVVDRPGRSANTIVTAWHCLEFYDDLSMPITFTLGTGQEEPFVGVARRLADGGGMHADWAILRLEQAVPADRIAAVTVHHGGPVPGRPITMAGYSRDPGLGMHGHRVTFDPVCQIIHLAATVVEAECTAYKGASGGAVMQSSDAGNAQLSGVISRGDGVGTVLYVPVSGFRRTLTQYLQ